MRRLPHKSHQPAEPTVSRFPAMVVRGLFATPHYCWVGCKIEKIALNGCVKPFVRSVVTGLFE